jgi:hypothetical protein
MTRPTMKRLRGLLLIVGSLFAASGCDYRTLPAIAEGPPSTPSGLGTTCSIGVDELPPENAAIDSASGACASRLCVKQAQERSADTSPLCTQACETDSDCQGGAIRSPQDATDKRCVTGFTCRAIFPNLSLLPFACKKMCACQDFLDPSTAPTPPAGCQ